MWEFAACSPTCLTADRRREEVQPVGEEVVRCQSPGSAYATAGDIRAMGVRGVIFSLVPTAEACSLQPEEERRGRCRCHSRFASVVGVGRSQHSIGMECSFLVQGPALGRKPPLPPSTPKITSDHRHAPSFFTPPPYPLSSALAAAAAARDAITQVSANESLPLLQRIKGRGIVGGPQRGTGPMAPRTHRMLCVIW